jgi:hypothetical protein
MQSYMEEISLASISQRCSYVLWATAERLSATSTVLGLFRGLIPETNTIVLDADDDHAVASAALAA